MHIHFLPPFKETSIILIFRNNTKTKDKKELDTIFIVVEEEEEEEDVISIIEQRCYK